MALDRLTAAGVELVPFDSSNLDEAASMSWGGGPESLDYELPESLARYGFSMCNSYHDRCGVFAEYTVMEPLLMCWQVPVPS